jgi:acetyl-CoA acyltransferase
MDKVVVTALEAVADVPDCGSLAVGGSQGAAVALGLPLGASGTRLAGTVAHQLARKGTGVGATTLRIGVGQGLALVLER